MSVVGYIGMFAVSLAVVVNILYMSPPVTDSRQRQQITCVLHVRVMYRSVELSIMRTRRIISAD